MNKTGSLRRLLELSELSFLIEAHNGLSAKIVEEAGFEGIWASGLCMSASMGVRDSNEASWTQILEILEFMSDATQIPILLDGDTGYGNFNNMRRLVKKLEQRGIAGVCIEDKLFPKANSFIRGDAQPLAEIDEFSGKIKAGKDTQQDSDFCIVARVEAFIAGWDLAEALKRAEAYRQAGADAILIHSKKSSPSEIVSFATEWANRAPLIVVPTTYYSAPIELFAKLHISTLIWANHLLRGAIAAMEHVAKTIYEEQSVTNIEDHVARLQEVFRLQGVSELLEAEEKYLTAGPRKKNNAIILAASRGEELTELTSTQPKAMISIAGQSILQRLVEEVKSHGIEDVVVVGGYKAETIDIPDIQLLRNPDYDTYKDLMSLVHALDFVRQDTLIFYGDLLMRGYIIRDLLATDSLLTVVVDSNVSAKLEQGVKGDYVICSRPDDRGVFGAKIELIEALSDVNEDNQNKVHGQWIGVLRVKGEGRDWVRESITHLRQRKDVQNLSMTDLLNDLVARNRPIRVVYISGHWLDVNYLPDIERATDFAKGLL
ncbi:MAG: phosphoenolpyruvate mutase [Acidobacteriota bacterium]|nr:phosphoenolpyruvate mutase [Acidobacteriota bacterium]